MLEGAHLGSVWPPELPDELRVAVEADAGERGFSHVVAIGVEGPVLLLAADALVVWHAPGELRRLGYDEVEVSKRRGKWAVALPPPPADIADPVAAAQPSPPAEPLMFEVTKDVGSRVRDRAQRALVQGALVHEAATAQAFRALDMPAARVREHVSPERLEPARPASLERATTAASDRGSGTTRGAAAGAHASAGATVASPGASAPTAAPPITGVVVSLLDPIGYVRVQPRDVLVAATSLAGRVLVDEHVTLVAGPDATLLATVAGAPSADPAP